MITFKKAQKKLKKIFAKDGVSSYCSYYRNLSINKDTVFLQAFNGDNLNGSIYYLLKELTYSSLYQNYTKYICIQKKEQKAELKKKFPGVKVLPVIYQSKQYYKILASVQFLITDTAFPSSFVKKEGQQYLNLWHGTPLKKMGKDDYYAINKLGNNQRNFLMADYLLYPNEYSKEKMFIAYMLDDLYDGKIIYSGYPRTSELLDESNSFEIRRKLNIEDKKVYAYMPTWRRILSFDNDREICMQDLLIMMDECLQDDELMYVNIHLLDKEKVDCTKFKKIKFFPDEYETYEFLKIADCLITDYSSVMFDYAVTGKKIVLFTYDEKKYLKERGLYFSLDSLPFARTSSVRDLFKEIRAGKNTYGDAFIDEYCKYDSLNVSKKLCELFILNNKTDLCIEQHKQNKKENILLYLNGKNIDENKTAVELFLKEYSSKDYNLYATFPAKGFDIDLSNYVAGRMNIIPRQGKMIVSKQEKSAIDNYRNKRITIEAYNKKTKDAFLLNGKRLYPDISFAKIVVMDGEQYNISAEFGSAAVEVI